MQAGVPTRLGFPDPRDGPRARDVLARGDYTEKGIGAKLDGSFSLSLAAADRPPLLRRTRDLAPLDALIRLLLLGVPVPIEAARAAFAPMPLEAWVAAGLVRLAEADGVAVAAVRLVPVGDLWLASDAPWQHGARAPSDFVMSPAATTLEVAHAMVREPSARTLDVGTGCGVLALRAASEGARVVATDVSPRALAFARLNARLNGVDRLDCREGDCFEPLAAERFDRILCNPPFVVGPSRRFLFRDGVMRGDALCRALVRSAPDHLVEGGFLQLVADVPERSGEDWRAGVGAWLEGLPCDAVVWLLGTQDVSDYAITWIVGAEAADAVAAADIYDRWMEAYAAEGIEAVSHVLVTLRRRDAGTPWTLLDDTPRTLVGPCGDDLLATFRVRDRFGPEVDPADLLATPVRLAADLRIEQQHATTPQGVRPVETRLLGAGGVRFSARVEPRVAAFVARCDGTRPAGALLRDMADTLGEGPAFVEGPGLSMLRDLVGRGILVPGPPS